uniref:Protein E8^E2C n=1 Tax=Human papillomavirus TaxID=10566 RepID=A0A451G3M1_9PAPI|nr:MAG: E2 protein [Human papillomavirus]
MLLLKSLKKSPFGKEEWSLNNTSAELTHTAPPNTFKKDAYIVDVHFDNNPANSFPYTNWNALYIQDDDDTWYKTPGEVDINGLYFVDKQGDKNYFTLFAADAERFGTTGQWTVHFKNETLSTSVISSQESLSGSVQGSTKGLVSSSWDTPSTSKATRRRETEERKSNAAVSSTVTLRRRRRGRGEQGESRPKRRRTEESTVGLAPGQVGRRHHTVPRTGLTRFERLEAEAADPPIIIVKGGSNNLKCWRYRIKKTSTLFTFITTVFRWAEEQFSECNNHRMLIAFENEQQRSLFLTTVSLPKGASYALGSLASL